MTLNIQLVYLVMILMCCLYGVRPASFWIILMGLWPVVVVSWVGSSWFRAPLILNNIFYSVFKTSKHCHIYRWKHVRKRHCRHRRRQWIPVEYVLHSTVGELYPKTFKTTLFSVVLCALKNIVKYNVQGVQEINKFLWVSHKPQISSFLLIKPSKMAHTLTKSMKFVFSLGEIFHVSGYGCAGSTVNYARLQD